MNAGVVAGNHTTLVADTGANALSAATIHGYSSLARPGNRFIVVDLEKHFDRRNLKLARQAAEPGRADSLAL